MTQDLDGVTAISDLDVVEIGCDSSASWSKRFAHLSANEDVSTVAKRLVDVIGHEEIVDKDMNWRLPGGSEQTQGADIHLVITGGEPLLKGWQKCYGPLLRDPSIRGLRHLTFETNGTQSLESTFRDHLMSRGRDVDTNVHLTWSVSPKLSQSGEPSESAIQPDVLCDYSEVPNSSLVLKFVVRDAHDFEEAEGVVAAYRRAGVCVDEVFAMPEGALKQEYHQNRTRVAQLCMRFGFRFSPRLHVDLFGNRFGT